MKIRVYNRKININDYTIDESELIHLIQDYKESSKGKGFMKILKKSVEHFKSAKKMMLVLFRSISFQKLSWTTHFGTGEASSTGVLTGGVWMVKGTIIGFLKEQTEMKCQPNVTVVPHFQQKGFYSKIDCIVSIRLGKAIQTGMHLLRNVKPKEEVYT